MLYVCRRWGEERRPLRASREEPLLKLPSLPLENRLVSLFCWCFYFPFLLHLHNPRVQLLISSHGFSVTKLRTPASRASVGPASLSLPREQLSLSCLCIAGLLEGNFLCPCVHLWWSYRCSLERERGSLRVIFPSPGQMLKTAAVDFWEVQISFTGKKPELPSSGRVSNY